MYPLYMYGWCWGGLFPHCFLVVYNGYEHSDEATIFLHFIAMLMAGSDAPILMLVLISAPYWRYRACIGKAINT